MPTREEMIKSMRAVDLPKDHIAAFPVQALCGLLTDREIARVSLMLADQAGLPVEAQYTMLQMFEGRFGSLMP